MNAEAIKWLRQQIGQRLETARKACHDSDGHWVGRQQTRYGPHGHLRDSEGDVIVYDEGSPSDAEFEHIALNDPQDVIARCEVELVILDEHYILWAAGSDVPNDEQYGEYSVVTAGIRGGPGDREMGCVTCHYKGFGAVHAYGICRTVKAVASGYRYRDGYAGHWGEA